MSLLIKNLLKIKNAHRAKKITVNLVLSRYTIDVLNLLKKEGYIRGFSQDSNKLKVFFKYINNKTAFKTLKLITKPSRQVSLSFNNILKSKLASTGLLVFTTSQGIFTKTEVLEKKLGGIPLFIIK